MLNLISAILFSLSANLDNIAIGISYGIKKIHIPYISTFFIAIFTTIFTVLSMILGKSLSMLLNENIINNVSSYVLILFGIFYIIEDLIKSIKTPSKKNTNNLKNIVDKRCYNPSYLLKNIKIKEITNIIFILSVNNIATGIAASATGIDIFVTTVFSFLFSFLFLAIGNNIGKKVISKYIEKYSTLASSIILIIIGLIQL